MVTRVLLVAGVSIVAAPFWQPVVSAYLEIQLKIPVGASAATAGWILIALALANYGYCEWIGVRTPTTATAVKREKDEARLVRFLHELDTVQIENVLYWGSLDSIHTGAPYFHAIGIENIASATDFKFHDQHLDSDVKSFAAAYARVYSMPLYFDETSNPDLHKFRSQHKFGSVQEWEVAIKKFHDSIGALDRSWRSLFERIHEQFPNIDTNETNLAARRALLASLAQD